VSGACTVAFPQGATFDAKRGNWDQHYYPTLYYAAVGVLASAHIGLSVLAIRALNASLYVGLITALYLLLPAFRRRALIWTQAVTMIPLGFFVVASDNPSSWAVASAATLWLALVGYYEAASGWRRLGLGAVALVATVMGAGARADAALFSIMAVAIAVIFSIKLRRQFFLLSILPAALVVVAALLYLTGAQSQALTGGLPGSGQAQYGPVSLLWGNIIDVLSLYAGTLGTWALGWFDTTMPSAVWVPMIMLCGLAIFTGIARPRLRKTIVLVCVGAGLLVYPMVLLVQSHVLVGTQVQPRYVLPLLVIFVGIALHQDRANVRLPVRLAHLTIAVALLAIANAVALHENIRRYVSGASFVSPDLNHGVNWWWGIGASPMATWLIGAGAYTIGTAIAIYLAERRGDEPETLVDEDRSRKTSCPGSFGAESLEPDAEGDEVATESMA
jgi:hypothetical protein